MRPVVFISGGSRGIGAALVLEAARAGWDVAMTWHTQRDAAYEVVAAAAQAAPDARVKTWQLDVRDPAAVDRVVAQAIDTLGGLQAVVCNAGISHNGLAFTLDDSDWNAVLDTNVGGAFRLCRAVLPELLAQRHGRILLLGSLAAQGATGQVAYATSKAALVGLAGTLSKEYGRRGVTTNVVVPGFFETDMTREQLSEANREHALRYCPVGRIGQLQELARTMVFLLSDPAAYINGASIPVTGGLGWVP